MIVSIGSDSDSAQFSSTQFSSTRERRHRRKTTTVTTAVEYVNIAGRLVETIHTTNAEPDDVTVREMLRQVPRREHAESVVIGGDIGYNMESENAIRFIEKYLSGGASLTLIMRMVDCIV